MTAGSGPHQAPAPADSAPPAEASSIALPGSLRSWLMDQAERMGLPTAGDFVLLLIRLEKQRQDLAGVDERYQQLFRG